MQLSGVCAVFLQLLYFYLNRGIRLICFRIPVQGNLTFNAEKFETTKLDQNFITLSKSLNSQFTVYHGVIIIVLSEKLK